MPTSYNCDCDDAPSYRTLLQLRQDMMRALGFAAQVASPPPGLDDFLTEKLQSAQRTLYERYDVLRTERMFTWTLVNGTNMYGIADNDEVTGATCTKQMDPRHISWVGISRDSDQQWFPLARGIPPEFYNHTDSSDWPQRYEVRQCIEVWPTPSTDAGKLRVRGRFGIQAFTADADKPTIDDHAVFLLALANAKAHYRHPDAGNYVQQLESYIADVTAGLHAGRRYIPGERRDVAAMPRPVWVPLP